MRTRRSFFWFSFWVLGCGLALALFPRLLLDMAGITVSSDIMVRVFGTVLLSMGVSYLVAAGRPSFAPLYLASVYTRFSAPLIVAFTAVDALGALWTALALRRDQAALSIP